MGKFYLFYPHLFEGEASGGVSAAGGYGGSISQKLTAGGMRHSAPESQRGQAAAVQTGGTLTGNGASTAGEPFGRAVKGKERVLYGKQPEGAMPEDNAAGQAAAAPSTKTTSDTLEAKRAAFDEMISGEYRDLYNERVQNIINRRFKESKQQEAALQKQSGLMELLSQRYGVDAADYDGLTKAIAEDDGFFEDAAAKAGLSVSQYKEMRRLQAENAGLRQAAQQQEAQRQAQEQYANWMREAETVKARFPQFDFRAELQNESFGRLLKAGIPVEQAYMVLHQDELMQSAMAATANNVAAATAQSIQARGQRPRENGVSSEGGVTVRSDVTKLTAADRAEIARRVARGDIISF